MMTQQLTTEQTDVEATVQEIVVFAQRWFRIRLRPHQIDWVRFILTGGEFMILLSPRGHGKSTVTFIYLLWRICRNPLLRVMIIANTDELASDRLRTIKVAIENNEELREEYGLEMGKPWRLDECFLVGTLNPVLSAAASQARVTGKRFDICLMDDAISEEAASPAMLRRFKNWVEGQLFYAMDPAHEQVIVLGTRKGVNDWYSELLANPDIRSRVDQAIKADGTPLWPLDEEGRGFTIEKLRKKQRANPPMFAQEMMNQPSPPEGYRFNRDWLKFYSSLPPHEFLTYYQGIDPGAGLGERATYFATTIVAHDERNDNIYIVEQFRDKIPLDEQIRKAEELYIKYEPKQVMCESVMLYAYLAAEFEKKLPRMRVVDYIHFRLKGSEEKKKEARIESRLVPLFRDGKIFMPDPEFNHFSRIFIEQELMEFGGGGSGGIRGGGGATGSDMDMLDSLVLAIDEIEPVGGDDDAPIIKAVRARTW